MVASACATVHTCSCCGILTLDTQKCKLHPGLQGLRSLMTRLDTALRDASLQRGLSRSSSRRTTRETNRQMSRTSSNTRRRSMASPSSSIRQSREGFEANLAAERSVLPAGLFCMAPCCLRPPIRHDFVSTQISHSCRVVLHACNTLLCVELY